MTLEEEIRERQKKEPVNPESPDMLYLRLVDTIRCYHPSDDISLVERAYRLADEAHGGIKRKSGEPYIIHPLHVAIILAELELDKESIAAALLHDVIEDTKYNYADIEKLFGKEIADLVNGVTKLTNLPYASSEKEEIQAENLRKMFLAMAKDIRVIIIKLADRLHNMRTLQFMKPEKQIEKSRETMDIYSPLAQRLGISKVKIELDDIALSYLEPEAYKELKYQIEENTPEREKFVEGIVQEVKQHVYKETGIDAQVYGRVKHLFSIYKKMKNQNKRFDQIYDVFAIRAIVSSEKDCYAVLGIVHKMYTPVPGRFKDYIAMPKPNNYKSLHTTVVGKDGRMFEVQIRTEEMHRIAEYGIAAHWKYKEGKAGENITRAEIDKMTWLRELLELQKDSENNSEFVNEVKSELNLFSDSVFCFTPQGKVINMPKGSTTIDFAYRIHTAVGNRMVGAVVNGKVQPISYEIQNGDRIQIQTSLNASGPSRDWLKLCKSPQARTKIRQWFKAQNRPENIEQGRAMLEKYCKAKNINFQEINTPAAREKVMHKYGFMDWNAVMAAVGHGGLKEGQVVNKMRELFSEKKPELTDEAVLEKFRQDADKNARLNKEKEREKAKNGVRFGQFVIKSFFGSGNGSAAGKGENMVCVCAHCCNPLPGDEIIGYVTRNRGIKVHRTDCKNFLSFSEAERARSIEVEWADQPESKDSYGVELLIYAYDRQGIIAAVSQTFAENNYNIEDFHTNRSHKGVATLIVRITVEGIDSLNFIVKKLRQIEGIYDIKRSNG
ncbi:MAG: bifunctional (p)ppGpp synthetase/guanosine-3',5'-bis(diphosphate) 3'-pyrophosphohydrolase [Lachnospiraceae bacterium]|nr:bifunctional (p)ppGpp synthetase/guanosine-3',5'-bis(diphosphate) 3'-pyrophosphohydrolase [Lachnospiraceae bacterium]